MKTKSLIGAIVGLLVLGILAPVVLSAGGVRGIQKIEGAWIGRVPDTDLQWTMVMLPKPSGRRASGHGSLDVGFALPPPFGPTDFLSPLLVEAEMTGPETFDFNVMWYGMRKPAPGSPMTAEIAYIGRDWGTMTFVAPNKMRGVHRIEVYLPFQDADGDGLPDEGQPPLYTEDLESINTRVPSPR